MPRNKTVKDKGRTRFTLSTREAIQYDALFFNNPVFVSGYAMAAAVGGAYDLRNAHMLALAGVLLIIPVRLLGELTAEKLTFRLRIVLYVFTSALISIPVMVLLYKYFAGSMVLAGLYLLLLFMDSVVISRSVVPGKEGARLVFNGAFSTAGGYALALLLVGAVRELLSSGCLFGNRVFGKGIWAAASSVPCGFVIVALMAGIWQCICSIAKRIIFIGGGEDE